jgi:hypothetical protein
MLVENRRFSSYHRPVRDGMWVKENNHFYCLNQDSPDLKMSRMRKIEIENTKIGSVAAIYTMLLWHCCRDAMLRVSRNAMLRVFFGDKRKATNPVRHCRLDTQRREASRLYISGDSDFRQNDDHGYGDSDFRQNDSHGYGDSDLRRNDGYRYTEAMSRMGLNMYNPLQAERSWGYKITTTLSELRSSSICYHINHLNHINHSSDKRGRMVQAMSISFYLVPSSLITEFNFF